jgi:hypothetical protein
MTENPYQSPVDAQRRYFTDDITLLPITVIWRTCRRQGLTGWFILFPMFLGRKLIRWRFPANHATCRVDRLSPITNDDLPPATRIAIDAFETVCRQCGMEQVSLFRPPWIGNKKGVFSVWIEPGGEVYCNITQIDIRLGTFHKSKTVFACHSKLKSGVELHTSPLAPEDWIPEMVPPDQDIAPLPPDTDPLQVVEQHRQRIAGRSDVVRFTSQTLLEEIVRGSQKQFDFLVAKGIYAPLSEVEIQRLHSVGKAVSPTSN